MIGKQVSPSLSYSSSGAQIELRQVTNHHFGKTGDRIEAGDLRIAFRAQLDCHHKGKLFSKLSPAEVSLNIDPSLVRLGPYSGSRSKPLGDVRTWRYREISRDASGIVSR